MKCKECGYVLLSKELGGTPRFPRKRTLLIVLGILGTIAFWSVMVYVAWHFISKFW